MERLEILRIVSIFVCFLPMNGEFKRYLQFTVGMKRLFFAEEGQKWNTLSVKKKSAESD